MTKRSTDYFLLILVILLVLFGLVMVYDASFYYAQVKFDNPIHFFSKQLIGAVIGVACMLFFTFFDYKKLEKVKVPLLIVSFILLCMVWVPGIGVKANGASRWVDFGFISIQPSEVAKFAIVFFMASTMAHNKRQMKSFKYGLLPYLLILGVFGVLIVLQPNFSMVISITMVVLIMLFIGGASIKQLLGLSTLGAIGGAYLVYAESYRLSRFLVFLDPWKSPRDESYQLVQSLYALGGGGLFGVGFNNSRQKNLFLPERESDFIFSIIGEEFGYIGCVLLLAVFLLVIWRGIRIASGCQNAFGSLLAAGITISVAISVIINVAVVTGSIPPTGLPLPLISFGSSSLIISMAEFGILLNISRQIKIA